MVLDNKEVSKFWTTSAIILVGVLSFFLIRPVLIAVVSGLILAYLLMPLYNRMVKIVKNRSVAAIIILLIVLAAIIIPLWYIIPMVINQFFDLFKVAQTIDLSSVIKALLPSSSDEFVRQAGVTITALLSKASATILNFLVNFLKESPTIFLNIFVVGFVFFFGLRDSDKLTKLAKELSPLNRAKEHLVVQQFKDLTDSIIYGHLIVGVLQGLLAGIGFLIFGVDNALLLTILAIFASIIPILGPYIVYIPIAIFMLLSGNTATAIAYILYNLVIVSTLDNFLRAYIVARKTQISSAVVFVGMMGGLFMFGVIGLILGPLILAYFFILLQLYKEKELQSLFIKEEPVKE